MVEALQTAQLRKTYSEDSFTQEMLANHRPLKAIIGQERAVKALHFGLGNKASGFNIYIAGYPGEGKLDAVQHFLQDLALKESTPNDWVYVNNFQDPYYPKNLSLPKGGAREFKTDIKNFIDEAAKALIKSFESDEYSDKREEINKAFREREQEVFSELDKKAREENFIIKRTPVEIIALPLVGGRPMTDKEFFSLTEEEKRFIVEQQASFKEDLKAAARKARELEKEYNQTVAELEQKVALFAIETLLEELIEKYQKNDEILQYLEEVKNDILNNLSQFLNRGNSSPLFPSNPEIFLRKYEVNIIVDNSERKGTPIILELHPTYNNLLGKMEKESHMGTFVTDFTLVRGGSLHRANGGYIILPVEDLLRDFFAWESLKRALRNREIIIEDAAERWGFITTKSLKPEPVPLNVQVILIGRPRYYYLLYELDDDFKDLFKVKADFDITMPPTEENIRDFIGFLNHLCDEEHLLPLDSTGIAKILEHGHRMAEHQEKISNRFGEISDIVREANHYAKLDEAEIIKSPHINKAVEERHYRSNLLQEKIQEYIRRGVIMIDTNGEKVGQVNGLSVLDLGDIAFGRPTRITASVSIGKNGVINIEKEAEMSGPIHTKGVLILSGYLSETFGREYPLSLSAQLVFEQSYSEVEGDSASSTELYALLSALSGLPLRQYIAVTGSINQKGEIQAVGGINEKIEGFYEICKQEGLNGKQGVIIPKANIPNLMLKEEVVEAVKSRQFHIWGIQSIDEGIEILTGVKAGAVVTDPETGEPAFEMDSVKDRVDKRLREMAHKKRLFSHFPQE